jgi:hypothetical protein
MAYAEGNPKTKKELKAWLAAGKTVGVFSPGPWPHAQNGRVAVEGPHYPKPHSWYADCLVKDGLIISVK